MIYVYHTIVILVTLAVVIFLPLSIGTSINRWNNTTNVENYLTGLMFILSIVTTIGFSILIFKSFNEVFFK